MDIDERIAQFEKMAQADPDNDMAHFSLGGVYTQAERTTDAARAYLRCIEVNPGMSKAYQLGGEALISMGDKEHAAEVLSKGYVCAAERGDLLPKNAIGELLTGLGAPIPEVEERAIEEDVSGGFVCKRTGTAGTQLPSPPFRGPIGEWIQANISAQTWREWIGQGTKVINELRLDLSREADQESYDRNMHEYLGIDDALLEELLSA